MDGRDRAGPGGAEVEAALDQWFARPDWRDVYADGPPVRDYMRRAVTAAYAARPPSPGDAADLAREVERLRERDILRGLDLIELANRLGAAEARADAAEGVAVQLRADLANAAGGMAEHTCEGCGAAIMVDENAATTTDVAGCWPYVTGEDRHGECWRYRTAEGVDRAWPACALASPKQPEGTAEQADAVRLAALEEAAQTLDRLVEEYVAQTKGQWRSGETITAWRDGAKAIRALAPRPSGGDAGRADGQSERFSAEMTLSESAFSAAGSAEGGER